MITDIIDVLNKITENLMGTGAAQQLHRWYGKIEKKVVANMVG